MDAELRIGAPGEPAACHHAAMSTGDHFSAGYSKACWRCKHWGGFAHGGATHSLCTRPCACPVQASPSTGCASWTPGDGNRHPDGWAPVGFKNPRAKDPIAEHRAPISTTPPPRPQIDSRPAGRSEGLVFDQKCEAQAWRLADALLARARSSP